MDEKEIQKYIKQVRNEANEDMERYLGSLQEKTDDRFKAVMEGQQAMNERMGRIEKTLDSNTEMIGSLTIDMTVVKTRLGEIDKKLITIEE